MDFRPLYGSERQLYALGANLSQGQLDGACYDLLASESCLTSYLTVARGDAPRRHWFMLGRPYIHAAGQIGLMSWGGTMFEYLMPRLLLRSLPGTLLAEACRTAVARQIEYGRLLGIPWGISESAFNDRFLEGDYRYQSFGVPGLGLKRGLENDRVVAPYATTHGDDDRAPRGPGEPPTAGERGGGRALRLLRGRRLHPGPVVPGRPAGRRPVVHGSPSGNEPRGLGQRALRRCDAAAVPQPSRWSARRTCCSRSGFPPTLRSPRRLQPNLDHTRPATAQNRRDAESSPHDTVYNGPSHAFAFEHALPRHGDQCRFGIQHVPGTGRDALA